MTASRIEIGALVALVGAVATGAWTVATTKERLDTQDRDIAKLGADGAVRRIAEAKKDALRAIEEAGGRGAAPAGSALQVLNVPVGTIVAYGGGPDTVPGGWLLCDGGAYEKETYPRLADVLERRWGGTAGPAFRVPDLQGAFLRGVDPTGRIDPDAQSRRVGSLQGKVGTGVGTFQAAATADPTRGLQTVKKGKHTHKVPTHGLAAGILEAGNMHSATDFGKEAPSTSPSDPLNHDHPLVGWDKETRPVNAAVYWIIRAKDLQKQ